MIMSGKEDHAVMRSKFAEERIALALKQADVGTPVEDLCRKMEMSVATSYNWRKTFGGLSPSEAKLLKHLEKENATRVLLREQDWSSRANSVKHLLPAHFPFEQCA
jgi:putative transposase